MAAPIIEKLHIDCPRATVFDQMADVRNLTLWNGGASKAEMKSAEPIGRGSQFLTVNRGQELESTITAFDRPDRLEFAVTSKGMDVNAAFTFGEAADGTTLAMAFEPRPKGLMAVLFPLLRPIIRRDLAKQHLGFKRFCEERCRSQDG